MSRAGKKRSRFNADLAMSSELAASEELGLASQLFTTLGGNDKFSLSAEMDKAFDAGNFELVDELQLVKNQQTLRAGGKSSRRLREKLGVEAAERKRLTLTEARERKKEIEFSKEGVGVRRDVSVSFGNTEALGSLSRDDKDIRTTGRAETSRLVL